jgi:hypothetical protein
VFTGIARDMTIWSARSSQLTAGEILLKVIHLPSKMGGSTASVQWSFASQVAREIDEQETARGHENMIVLRDFIMKSFDEGMTAATGFRGVRDDGRGMAGVQRPDSHAEILGVGEGGGGGKRPELPAAGVCLLPE